MEYYKLIFEHEYTYWISIENYKMNTIQEYNINMTLIYYVIYRLHVALQQGLNLFPLAGLHPELGKYPDGLNRLNLIVTGYFSYIGFVWRAVSHSLELSTTS